MTKTEFKRAIDFLHKWQYELELMDDATPGNSLAAVITALQICSGEHTELVVVPREATIILMNEMRKELPATREFDNFEWCRLIYRAMIAASQDEGE